jgi:hypothetical protein
MGQTIVGRPRIETVLCERGGVKEENDEWQPEVDPAEYLIHANGSSWHCVISRQHTPPLSSAVPVPPLRSKNFF